MPRSASVQLLPLPSLPVSSVAQLELVAVSALEAAAYKGQLSTVPNDDPYSFSDAIMAGLTDGSYRAAEIRQGGRALGLTVYAVDCVGDWRELVSVATVARSGSVLRYDIDNALTELAQANECKSVRLHTARPGLVRECLKVGYHAAEVVLRRYINV